MDPYRLYILDSLSGEIAHERWFIAKDDETAVWIAEGLQGSRAIELWCGGSKIHAWKPIAAAPSVRATTTNDEPVQTIAPILN